jgi:hypothetical protein
MAYNAYLELGGVKYKVRHCSYSLHQNIDENGRPSSNVMGGTIQIEVEGSEDKQLINWMVDPIGKMNGKVAFFKTGEEGELKSVEFEDAFCTSYTESMDAISNSPMVENVVISAKKLKFSTGAEFTNVWESRL